MKNDNIAIIIPARLGSTRLKQKALLPIGGKSMIERVIERVEKSGYNNIYLATDSEEIADKARSSAAKPIMTRPEIESGTDRVYEAFKQISHKNIEYIVNVQGDMPFVSPDMIRGVIQSAAANKYQITTPYVRVGKDVAQYSSNVKITKDKNNKALYFSRSLIPHGGDKYNYHVGIYVFRKDALERFVSLEQSALELHEKLEQLRAMENGMDIHVWEFDGPPLISVDTMEDYEKACKFLKS